MCRPLTRACVLAAMLLAPGCGQSEPPTRSPTTSGDPGVQAGEALSVVQGNDPRAFPGLHNVCRVSGKLISGGVPEDDEGFASLHKLGVKTIISVDGARPDVERARRLGFR